MVYGTGNGVMSMRVGWYLNRLRSMEPAEILHRLGERRRKLVSRRRDQGWARYSAAPLRAVFPSLADSVRAAGPAQRQAIAAAAASALAGRFSALGVDWPARAAGDLYPAALWRLDPVTGGAWPDAATYAFDIDFRAEGQRGDVKYVWEANRLQFLVPLAAQAVLGDDGAALKAIEAAIASWHAANPPFGGVGWASGIEVAVRSIGLIAVHSLVGARLSDHTIGQLGEILAASAYWLPRFPSRFSSANNHLVAELAGEYLIGLALGRPDDTARAGLIAEIDRQILPDGAGAEQTPSYAAFTAELALLCAKAAAAAGAPFPSGYEARLLAFAGFVAALGRPTPRLGDDDEGRLVTLGAAFEADYPASVAAAIAGLYGKPGPPPAGDDFRTLIFGPPAADMERPKGLIQFMAGGLSVWHGQLAGRKVRLTFDHGPLGYLSIAAHGHADALSLTLDIDGVPVLVDPGTYLYASGGRWRDWFRSTPAHNTLNLEGASQSLMSGPFNWSHKARATLAEAMADPLRLVARHDGYQRRFGVVHERTVARDGEALLVTDRLLGGGRQAEIVWQLAPGLVAARNGNSVTVSRNDAALLRLDLPEGAMAIAIGGDGPGQGGWVSERFGSRLPAARISWQGVVGETGATTLLTPLPGV